MTQYRADTHLQFDGTKWRKITHGANAHPFLLPANDSIVRLGLLTSTVGHNRVLGIGSYWGGGHAAIHRFIEHLFGEVTHIYWGGELALHNATTHPAAAKLTVANETSGVVHGKIHCPQLYRASESHVENNIAHLSALSSMNLLPVAAEADWHAQRFDEADRHLFKPLNRFNGGNARHALVTAVMAMTTHLEVLEQQAATNDPIDINKQSAALIGSLAAGLSSEMAPGKEQEQLDGLVKLFDKRLHQGSITEVELQSHRSGALLLRQLYIQHMHDEIGNRYDVFALPRSG